MASNFFFCKCSTTPAFVGFLKQFVNLLHRTLLYYLFHLLSWPEN